MDDVQIVIGWEEAFGITFTDDEAIQIRTPRMAANLICRKLGMVTTGGAGRCLSQHGFYRLRRAFEKHCDCPRTVIAPHTRLAAILPRKNRRECWRAAAWQIGVPDLPYPVSCFGLIFRHYRTVGELVRYMVARQAQTLKEPDVAYTHSQVREIVRAIIANQIGVSKFSDDADLIYDLEVD
jgi:hypothetical protein